MLYTNQELNNFSYRELQAIAKPMRDKGLLPNSFKLNGKKQNLIDAIAMFQIEQVSTVNQETSNKHVYTVTYPYKVSKPETSNDETLEHDTLSDEILSAFKNTEVKLTFIQKLKLFLNTIFHWFKSFLSFNKKQQEIA